MLEQTDTPLKKRHRPRPLNHNLRRASQPASLAAHVAQFNRTQNRSAEHISSDSDQDILSSFTSSSPSLTRRRQRFDNSSSGSSSSSRSNSDTESDDEWWTTGNPRIAKGKHREVNLEYLDLSVSLPFTIAMMRDNLLSYLATLEEHAKAIAARVKSQPSSPTTRTPPSSSSQHTESLLHPFYAQLDALREDLRRLALLFPSAPMPSPSTTLTSSQAALVAKSQSLAAILTDRINEHRPGLAAALLAAHPRRLVTMASGADVSAVAANTLAKVQGRCDSLHEMYATITLRDCWEEGKTRWSSNKDYWSSAVSNVPSSVSAAAAAAASVPSWDSIMASVKESSVKAGEVVRHSMHEAEAVLYQRASELANEGSRLISYTDLPHLWRNNEHILSGYRFIPLQNWGTLLKSTFQLHNETVNIHSHIAGALIVLPLFWPSKGLDEHTTWADRLVQTIYLVAAMKCLVSSVFWHIFSGCSDAKWFERAACVDYSGVALLVAASVWTTIYNEFYCQPNLAMLYSLSTLVVGIVGALVPWASWFNERQNKSWRIVVFLTMCFTSLAPFGHAVFEHGLHKTLSFLSPIIPSLMCYIIGLCFYATNWPERAWPGRFDLFLHAHQIWHVSIVMAILFHYRAALQFHANRFEFSCTYNPLTESAGASLLPDLQIPAATALLRAAGGLHGVEGLQRADEKVHGWRIVMGSLGGGAVGRLWEVGREWLQRW